jgi:hypothetical protein
VSYLNIQELKWKFTLLGESFLCLERNSNFNFNIGWAKDGNETRHWFLFFS